MNKFKQEKVETWSVNIGRDIAEMVKNGTKDLKNFKHIQQ